MKKFAILANRIFFASARPLMSTESGLEQYVWQVGQKCCPASRWISCLNLGGANPSGNLVPSWDPKYGLGITALRLPPWLWKHNRQAERVIESVWGEHESLPSCFTHSIARIDNQTSRLLLRGNDRRQVYFGPLAYARHACRTHANIIPDSQPDPDRTRDIVSGLSTSDYAGAYTISFNRIEAGEDLAFRSSESYAAPDDNFGLCVICARARDAACEDIELKDEEVDMSIVFINDVEDNTISTDPEQTINMVHSRVTKTFLQPRTLDNHQSCQSWALSQTCPTYPRVFAKRGHAAKTRPTSMTMSSGP